MNYAVSDTFIRLPFSAIVYRCFNEIAIPQVLLSDSLKMLLLLIRKSCFSLFNT